MPRRTMFLPWLAAAVAWMPAAGWLAHGLAPLPLLIIRLLVVSAASAMFIVKSEHLAVSERTS